MTQMGDEVSPSYSPQTVANEWTGPSYVGVDLVTRAQPQDPSWPLVL